VRFLRHKGAWLTVAFAVGLWLFWQWGPIEAVFAIRHLSDPAKLATLAERGANPRLNKIVYWLDQARGRWMSPETAITLAQLGNGIHGQRAALVKASLLRNLKLADEMGVWTHDNRDHLRRGQAAIAMRGPYRGEAIEIDHIVPLSLAPEVGNELANLEMMPRALNRRKSNHIGPRQLDYAARLCKAGLLEKKSLARIQMHVDPP
jgi:hypothetical protein